MPEYLTEKNQILIDSLISDLVEDHMYTKKKATYKKINPT